MNQISPSQEQAIHQLVQALLTPAGKGECRCHHLDPAKIRILAWRNLKDPQTLILKIADQKFIGLVRSDKNGEQYWKFRDFYEDVPPSKSEPTSSPKTEPEVSLPSAESEPSPQSFSESDQVKKFKEKYGTADSPKSAE